MRFFYLFVLTTLFITSVHSKPTLFIPEPLETWKNWVLQDSPQYQCPFFYNNYHKKYCAWPSQLILEIQPHQGQFTSQWQVYNDSFITLPGDNQYWPQNVTVNQKPALVIQHNKLPAIKLSAGKYQIQGTFFWNKIPGSLRIPRNTGIISAQVLNKPLNSPMIKNHQLWLKSRGTGKTTTNTNDQMDLQVFRRINDDIPLQVTSHFSLEISGKQREIKLPYALLANFIPISLQSPLPARLEADGSLLIQVRPGRWQIELQAQYPKQLTHLSLAIHSPNWPAMEVWSFLDHPALRLVEVENILPIDPSQSNVPAQWKNLPAFQVKQGDTLHFKVLKRGDPEPEPNNLTITRNLWLDFSGNGYSVQDQISGTISQGWRLNSLAETHLGQVMLNNHPQLITQALNSANQGVELRKGRLQLTADSRIEGHINTLSATGWQQEFNHAQAFLHLPPGWHLLAVSGVDNDPNSWFSKWSLLDLFLVLIATLAVSRLWNNYWGFFALLTLALIWHEPNAPRFIWLNILAAIALIKALPEGYLLRIIKLYRSVCWISLVIITLPFLVQQIRTGIYPQLEKPWQQVTGLAQKTRTVAKADFLAAENSSPSDTLKRSMSAKMTYNVAPQVNFKRIDPNANLQTGTGLPQWNWTRIPLSWNGQVSSEQHIKLWYISPRIHLLLNLLRVFFVSVLSLLMFGLIQRGLRFTLKLNIHFLLLLCFFLPLSPANADYPTPELLHELKQRLLKAPDCLPACAQIQQMKLDITAEQLTLLLTIHTQENTAIPLPAQFNNWLPNTVLVDELPAFAMMRDQQGIIWINLKKGIHTVRLNGATPQQNNFTLPLTLKPHTISYHTNQWTITGLRNNRATDKQLHFTRLKSSAQKQNERLALSPNIFPAFIQIERTLYLDLDWHIRTRIIRVSATPVAVNLKVPLINGESITSAHITSQSRKVLIHMSANQRRIEWHSRLEKSPKITLTAPNTSQWSEIWKLDISPIWHISHTGIPAIHHQDQSGNWLPEWHPWPGEQLNISISRPEAVQGQTLTIDKSTLLVTPGKRNQSSRLEFDLRSSKGTQHTIKLPEKADLQSVSINGINQAIRQQEKNSITLPVKPGKQRYLLTWNENKVQSSWLTTPLINLGVASVNTHINLHLGQDRWVLLTSGPQLGPAVLFWGLLFVLALVAVALGKSHLTPLNHWQWFLLLIGLSQIPLPAALIVVAWLVSLAIREKQSSENRRIFNLTQVLLVILTLSSLLILFIAVEQGLLGSPDMQISGNQSSAFVLNWYQDRSLAQLPTATVISIPLISYRILMLLWSLWLAISLLNWLKWGWQCFSAHGLWKKKTAK